MLSFISDMVASAKWLLGVCDLDHYYGSQGARKKLPIVTLGSANTNGLTAELARREKQVQSVVCIEPMRAVIACLYFSNSGDVWRTCVVVVCWLASDVVELSFRPIFLSAQPTT
jgi:hypothetical protein